jgi:hypothetical protein
MKIKTISKPKDSGQSGWRNTHYHKSLGLKAAKEAGRVLECFEKELPNDTRPRQAIEAIRAWAQGKRELGMSEVRKLSLDAHAAASIAKSDAAIFAAHSAGQAVATWHVPTHAMSASWYAGKAMYAKKVDRLMIWFTTDHRGHKVGVLPRNVSTKGRALKAKKGTTK